MSPSSCQQPGSDVARSTLPLNPVNTANFLCRRFCSKNWSLHLALELLRTRALIPTGPQTPQHTLTCTPSTRAHTHSHITHTHAPPHTSNCKYTQLHTLQHTHSHTHTFLGQCSNRFSFKQSLGESLSLVLPWALRQLDCHHW